VVRRVFGEPTKLEFQSTPWWLRGEIIEFRAGTVWFGGQIVGFSTGFPGVITATHFVGEGYITLSLNDLTATNTEHG